MSAPVVAAVWAVIVAALWLVVFVAAFAARMGRGWDFFDDVATAAGFATKAAVTLAVAASVVLGAAWAVSSILSAVSA